jgi:hypothetical protein
VASIIESRPATLPAMTSGRTEEGSALLASLSGTTSCTGAVVGLGDSVSLAARVMVWATVRLAAEAVSAFGPSAVMTTAP